MSLHVVDSQWETLSENPRSALTWCEYANNCQWSWYSNVLEVIITLDVRYQRVINCFRIESLHEIVSSGFVYLLSLLQQHSFHIVNHRNCHFGQKVKSKWVNGENASKRRGSDRLTRTKRAKLNFSGYRVTPVWLICCNLLLYNRCAENAAHLTGYFSIIENGFYESYLWLFLLHVYIENVLEQRLSLNSSQLFKFPDLMPTFSTFKTRAQIGVD